MHEASTHRPSCSNVLALNSGEFGSSCWSASVTWGRANTQQGRDRQEWRDATHGYIERRVDEIGSRLPCEERDEGLRRTAGDGGHEPTSSLEGSAGASASAFGASTVVAGSADGIRRQLMRLWAWSYWLVLAYRTRPRLSPFLMLLKRAIEES